MLPDFLAQPRRKRWLDHPVEAAGVFALYGLFACLPIDTASGLGAWVGRTFGPRLSGHRRILRNLARAFPDATEAWRRDVARRTWENLGRTLGEYPHLRRLWNNPARVERVGFDRLREISGQGPVIVFSGHVANWELLPHAVLNSSPDAVMVYRRPNNRIVDRLIRRVRPGTDRIVPKGAEGARAIARTLKRGGMVGLLVDQKLSTGGLPVPFFGHDAMTAPAVAQFALRFDCPLIPIRVERLRGARFRVSVLPPLELPRRDDSDEALREALVVVNHVLESWIRERPEQWLWLHRRWGD